MNIYFKSVTYCLSTLLKYLQLLPFCYEFTNWENCCPSSVSNNVRFCPNPSLWSTVRTIEKAPHNIYDCCVMNNMYYYDTLSLFYSRVFSLLQLWWKHVVSAKLVLFQKASMKSDVVEQKISVFLMFDNKAGMSTVSLLYSADRYIQRLNINGADVLNFYQWYCNDIFIMPPQ